MSGSDPNLEPIELTEDFLRSLPKTDLHVHLDGSLRLETMLELADRDKVRLPADDMEGLAALLIQSPEKCASLKEYLEAFEITLSVLQEAEALTRTAYELAEDSHAENVEYLELRFSPILHQQRGLALATIVDAVLEGLSAAERDFGIKSGVLICAIRSMSPESSLRLAELTVAFNGRGVVGFDLAGPEIDNPPKRHMEAFYLILNNNINCTVHAGEAYGPASISQALHYCGAHRLGHGTRLREDASLLHYVNDHRIPLECCVTSNVQTHTVESFGAHPLRAYSDLGLRVTVNTDNRLLTDTTMTRELEVCVRKLGFDAAGIHQLLVNGFKSTFLPFHEKRAMLNRIVPKLDSIFGIVSPSDP